MRDYPCGVRISVRWGLIIAVASLALSTAATASAASLDARSDHVALNAYRSYLQSLVSITPAWRRTATAYVSSISGECPHVLRSLKSAQPGTFSEAALIRFGIEAGGDLDVATYPLVQPAFAKLALSLDGLRWTGAGNRTAITHFLAAESGLLHLAPSNLCSDARALAAAHGRSTAPATRRFVTKYAHRTSVAGQDGASLLTVLKRYATPSESGTVTKINQLLKRWAATVQNRLVPEGKKLLTALGI